MSRAEGRNIMSQKVFASDSCVECGDRLRVFMYGWQNPDPESDGADVYKPCPACFPDEFERLKQKYRPFFHQRKVERLLKASELPPLFMSKNFGNFETFGHLGREKVLRECRDFAENFPDRQEKGSCLLCMGPCGTGKGHLSAGIIHRVIEAHEATALFAKYNELVGRIKRSWDSDSEETEEEIMKSVWDVDLLVLDEIGVQFKSEFERLILYRVIDYRCEYLRPTILTTNFDLGELKRVVGERVFDRILNKESGNKVLAFNWPSYRRSRPRGVRI